MPVLILGFVMMLLAPFLYTPLFLGGIILVIAGAVLVTL
jgi:hypothetical protein